jgi:hypothetical protein
VLACQAIQVYYVNCIKDPAWSVVVETKPRNIYEVPENEEELYQEEEVQRFNTCMTEAHDEDDEINWSRNMVEDMVVGQFVSSFFFFFFGMNENERFQFIIIILIVLFVNNIVIH